MASNTQHTQRDADTLPPVHLLEGSLLNVHPSDSPVVRGGDQLVAVDRVELEAGHGPGVRLELEHGVCGIVIVVFIHGPKTHVAHLNEGTESSQSFDPRKKKKKEIQVQSVHYCNVVCGNWGKKIGTNNESSSALQEKRGTLGKIPKRSAPCS